MSQTSSALQRLLHFTLTHRSEVGATVTDLAGEETEAWRGPLTSPMALETCGKSMELNSSNWTPDPGPTAYLGGNQWILTMCLLRSLRAPSVLCASSHLWLQSWWAEEPHDGRVLEAELRLPQFQRLTCVRGASRLFSCCCGAPGAPAPAPWILVLHHRLNGLLICLSGSLLEKIKISFIFLSFFFFEKQNHDFIMPLIFIFKKMYLFWVARGKGLLGDGLIKNPHT